MALSFAEAIRKDLSRLEFIEEQVRKAPRRKPRRTGKAPAYGTMYALRNKRLAIREACLRLVQVVLTYTKETTGETKRYVVACYSYRYRRLKKGVRKMLFAWDMDDKHIKGFVLGNIKKVALTDNKFRPKWPVEIQNWIVWCGAAWFFTL